MYNKTDSSKNDILYQHLSVLSKCYSTGFFEELFPRISENVIMESQWVMIPNEGKDAVVKYFSGKGKTLRSHNCCPECRLVKLVGNLNLIDNAEMNINGEEKVGSFGLLYDNGKYALLMSQTLNNTTNRVIVDLTLDEQGLISRIDLCMPELFRFEFLKDEGSECMF